MRVETLDVGPVGHGGICIAHAPDGRAVLVRHALPGERVRVAITEERASYLRADAIEILTPSPYRVPAPCPWAGPGRCGGCDWQHVEVSHQRTLKAAVIAEQLCRLAGIEREVDVEAVPGDDRGLHWRTRIRLAVGPDGVAGLHRYRSHEIQPIDDCLLAHRDLDLRSVLGTTWPGDEALDVVASEVVTAAGRRWRVPPGGFWQVHPGAPDVLSRTVLDFADPQPSDQCLDLYAGVGLFAGPLAARAASGRVTAVESDRPAAEMARENLADLDNVSVVVGRVDRWLSRRTVRADVVVLDPPRKGAGRAVVDALARATPRRIVYVACDPSSLARDTALLAGHGYRLEELRAFDLFPMTAHVECVALFAGSSTLDR
ncbi:MAG TPA: class I SAM-dependent RNA methyltransferase [Mycobacteriales bacterium]|nr:class I SAM-dependent RNA methyltransferase [Mycobacteriales bacterium]